MRWLFVLALLVGCAKQAGVAPLATPSLLDVSTTEGAVRGVAEASYIAFRGIPYAAAPVGPLRFRPPEPLPPRHDQVLAAEDFGSACVQNGRLLGTGTGGEDCLFVNVFRPREPGTYPVMVWIHGGAFELGAADRYDPPALVEQGVVVVTLNYRLGVLGFLAHPALTAEGGASGDYGLLDQQAAMRWVVDNIAGFGGDPSNITLFGESAGGASVLAHLVSPTSEGLFHKAIVQSGAYARRTPDQATFAKTGAPTAGEALSWPSYPEGVLTLGTPEPVVSSPDTLWARHRCDFWQQLRGS